MNSILQAGICCGEKLSRERIREGGGNYSQATCLSVVLSDTRMSGEASIGIEIQPVCWGQKCLFLTNRGAGLGGYYVSLSGGTP